MKKDTTFVHMCSGDHLGDSKMSKKGTALCQIYILTNCDRQKRFLQNKRRRADLQNFKFVWFFYFLPRDLSHDLWKISDECTLFSTWKDHN